MISDAAKALLGEDAPDSTPKVRMMSPDGTIGEIPEDKVQEATLAGFKVLTNADLAHIFNRQELERRFFEKRFAAKFKPIRRIPRGGR